jgi:hypothetical protein
MPVWAQPAPKMRLRRRLWRLTRPPGVRPMNSVLVSEENHDGGGGKLPFQHSMSHLRPHAVAKFMINEHGYQYHKSTADEVPGY